MESQVNPNLDGGQIADEPLEDVNGGQSAHPGVSQDSQQPSVDAMVRLREEVAWVSSNIRSSVTLRAYRSDWKHFVEWCESQGLLGLPAEPTTVAAYLVSMSGQHKPATLTRRLTAISQAHEAAGHPSPASMKNREVADALKGLRRLLGTAQKVKTPLMTSDLHKVLALIPPSLAGDRDRALLLIGYAGGLRRSELAAARVEDLQWVKGEGIVLTLPRSKTDQEGQGRKVAITYSETNSGTCPVVALRDWLARAKINDGPIFRCVDRFGNVGSTKLHSNSVGEIVKKSVARAGYDPSGFAGHSLRAGFATQAARNGATVFDIMRQTGHRSVATLTRYIREAEQLRNSAARRLGL